jgi:hypothetical protein
MSDEIADVSNEEVASQPQEASTGPSGPSEPSGPSAPSAPTPAAQENYWDRFKTLPDFHGQDDRAIAARLYNALEREKVAARALAQYQQIMPVAQDYLANRPEFEKWRAAQQQQPNPQVAQAQQLQQQQQQPSWWNPPKVRDSYKRFLTKDEDGREVIDPNAPLGAREELYEYQQYKAEFAKKFLEDPQGALGPMVEDLAKKQAEEIVRQTLEQRDNEGFVSQIEKENSDWLFDSETGNVTPEGLLIHKYIEEAKTHGIQGPQARWNYAVAMTERDLLAQQFDQGQQQQAGIQQSLQALMQERAAPAPTPAAQTPAPVQQQAQPNVAQQNMQYLRKEASRNPSRSAGTAANEPRVAKPKMTFDQMLREDASSRGLI